MATQKKVNDALRAAYMDRVKTMFEKDGDDVLVTGSNEIALPCVDGNMNETFMVITFKIPTGSRDDHEPYDGYAAAEDYRMKCEKKAAKEKETAEKKAAKIAKDTAAREAKKKAKEAREA